MSAKSEMEPTDGEGGAGRNAQAGDAALSDAPAVAPISKVPAQEPSTAPALASEGSQERLAPPAPSTPQASVAHAPTEPQVAASDDEIDLIPVHVAHVQAEASAAAAAAAVVASKESKSEAAPSRGEGVEAKVSPALPPEVRQDAAKSPTAQEPVSDAPRALAADEATSPKQPPSTATKEESPPSPSQPPKPKTPRPNSLGNAYMQERDRKPTEGRIYFGIAAFILVFTGSLAVRGWWSSQPEPPAVVPELDTSRFDGRAERRQTILEEMEKAATRASQAQASGAVAMEGDHAARAPTGAAPTSPTGAQKAQRVARKGAAPAAQVEQPDPLRQQYEAEYGDASSTRAAAIRSRGQYEATPQQGPNGHANARGLVLQARLVTTVASSPAGASVIASLTQGMRMGGRYLAAQTEIHGEVRGGDNARVFVDFTYARLADGSTIDLDAVATDRSGRQGIPGLRPVTGRTAGSVGLSGGQAMARTAASAIPGVGGVLASGASAMVDAASEKSQRLDRDEVIVQANSNTPIAIYVRSAG